MPALLAAVWLGATGCTESSQPAPSASPSATTESAAPSLAEADCGPGYPYRKAPAYAGRGTHRVVVEDIAGDGRQNPVYQGLSTIDLPKKWVAPELKGRPWGPDPERAQLLICVTDVEERSPRAIGQCNFTTTSAPVFPATYTAQIYEVKTGRWITTLKIDSDETAQGSCPARFTYTVGSTVTVAQGIKQKTLRNRLRPLITEPVRQ